MIRSFIALLLLASSAYAVDTPTPTPTRTPSPTPTARPCFNSNLRSWLSSCEVAEGQALVGYADKKAAFIGPIYRTEFFPVSKLSVDGTYCTKSEGYILASGPKTETITCSDTIGEMHGKMSLPSGYASSAALPLRFSVDLHNRNANPSAATNLGLELECQCVPAGEPATSSWGSIAYTTLMFSGSGSYLNFGLTLTPDSTPVCTGTCEPEALMYFRLIPMTNSSQAADIRYTGVSVHYPWKFTGDAQ